MEFLLRLGSDLHAQGTPTPKIEEALSRCSKRLGMRGQFFATPTSLFFGVGEGSNQRTHMVRVEPGDVDLGRLVELDRVVEDVACGREEPSAARRRLEHLGAAARRHGSLATTAACGAASASAARLFGGGLMDVLLSAALGLAIGALGILMRPRPGALRILELAAGFLAAAGAVTAAGSGLAIAPEIVIVSALIALVPGLSLTVAMNELAMRHLVAGTVRLAGATMVLMTMTIGVAVGRSLEALFASTAHPAAAPAGWTEWPALLLAPLAFLVLFQARWRDAGGILLSTAVGFAGARFGAVALGPELGVFIGAFAVGLCSNALGLLTRIPASVYQVPGIMLLVPGSLGLRSLASFLEHDTVSGVETAFRTALVAGALVGGLLVASACFPPRSTL